MKRNAAIWFFAGWTRMERDETNKLGYCPDKIADRNTIAGKRLVKEHGISATGLMNHILIVESAKELLHEHVEHLNSQPEHPVHK